MLRWAGHLAGVATLPLSATLLVGCTSGGGAEGADRRTPTSPTATTSSESTASESTSTSPTNPAATSRTATTGAEPAEPPERPPASRFDVAAALKTVDVLAGRIGPREATSRAYAEAARYVERRLRVWSYDVQRQYLRVPAGNSWGVEVPAGTTWNVVATPVGFDPSRPFRIVGAHLDTVPQAPGAEDNASGVAVLLELARRAASETPRIPVVFVAFGAEEPRGEGDDLHHFGSQAMVSRLSPQWRRSLTAMLSLDRVGVGSVVPVCSGGLERPTVRAALLRAADRLGVPAESCLNQASDHWSFDKAGIPAARLGSTPYPAYHSEADRPGVVDGAQLRRVGQVAWEWLG